MRLQIIQYTVIDVLIQRSMASHLEEMAQQFSVVSIMGPRQSGKTTLAKMVFPDYAYVSMENLDIRALAKDDPRGFFAAYTQQVGLIIDEIQEAPELFSYMQGIVDQEYRPGFFVLTGSQNFLLHEKITQTLAGRIALLTLLPLSIEELKCENLLPVTLESQFIRGFYPQLYAQPINVEVWCRNYINTYIEKDIRSVVQISNPVTFQRFLKLCAARIGNLLNYASIARDADISPNTAKAWISILEASYIIKLLPPYHKNFNKRVIKSPKLYFYDTALVCSLLGIKTAQELTLHPLRGALFESMMVSEMFKYSYNNNQSPDLYFWRDVQGHEVDVIVEKSYDTIVPIKAKASMTIAKSLFKDIGKWKKLIKQPEIAAYVVYGGDESFPQRENHLYSWKSINAMLQKIYS